MPLSRSIRFLKLNERSKKSILQNEEVVQKKYTFPQNKFPIPEIQLTFAQNRYTHDND